MQSRLLKKPLIAAHQFGNWLAKENFFFGKLIGSSATIVSLGRAVSDALAEAEKEKVIHLDFAERQSGAA